jgi:cytoskeletal protein RodZ
MPPINPTEPEDELIAHIKNSLIGHEEEYLPGAWERFDKKEDKNKNFIFWFSRLSGVAAVLIIGLFWFLNDTPVNVSPDVAKNKTTKSPSNPDTQLPVAPKASSSAAENEPVVASAVSKQSGNTGSLLAKTAIPFNGLNNTNIKDQKIYDVPGTNNGLIDPLVSSATQSAIALQANGLPLSAATSSDAVAKKEGNNKTSFQDFLNRESKENQVLAKGNTTNKNDHKWDMALLVAPSIGNSNKLNMGYGVSMGYNLSNRVSLNSGISYNDLAASTAVTSSGSMDIATSSIARSNTKSLESIDARVSGIDIPLELKYNLSKKLYANVGISAFAVLNQKRSNNFISEKLEQQVSNDASSFADIKVVVLSERVTEEVPNAEVSGNKYIGFYNFSFGFKQKISQKNTFSVEPFMKVPMKEATKDNLRLIGTGVKLKFDF